MFKKYLGFFIINICQNKTDKYEKYGIIEFEIITVKQTRLIKIIAKRDRGGIKCGE